MNYHIVRGKEGVYVVAKVNNSLSDIYVDTRGFTLADWQQHRSLAAAILRADRGDVFKDASLDSFRGGVQELVGGLLKNGS